jgi:membrane dipeptidase
MAEPSSEPVPVVDLHVDLSYQLSFKGLAVERGSGQLLSHALLESGVHAVVLPLFIPHDVSPEGPRLEDLEASYTKLVAALESSPAYQRPGCHPVGSGGTRTLLSFEGAAPLAQDPEQVNRWVKRGARLFGLVHAQDNVLAGSAGMGPKLRPHAAGLSETGEAFVRRVYAAGAVVDVSHASDRAVEDVLRVARELGKPVVASHSNCRAVAAHARNLTDRQLAAIGRSGGVVGINFHGPYLALGRAPRLADVVAHVRHAVEVAGIDHVALGSDFEGGIRPPRELADVTGFPRLAQALEKSGMTRAQVAQVFGGNALRVLCRE